MAGEGRPTRAEINLDHINHNLRLAVRAAKGAGVMAVVKADAYGHGAEPVSQAVLKAGAARLGVATVEEGAALRHAGIAAPVHVLGWTAPWQVAEALEHTLTLTVFSLEDARLVSRAAVKRGRRARIHFKVDTGMWRVGFPAGDGGTLRAIEAACRLPGLEAEGIFTHFASSDDDREFTLVQLERFLGVVEALERAGISFPCKHAANSGAIWHVPESHLDLVRLGISLYGYHPAGGGKGDEIGLRPALSWKTAVAQVKDVPPGTTVSYGRTFTAGDWLRLATLPVGYADGYSRALSSRGEVLLAGRRGRIAGRVCMDQIVVALPRDTEVSAGDEAVLIGRQGQERITADDMAAWLGTISYEVLCAIGKRVPRLYNGRTGQKGPDARRRGARSGGGEGGRP